MTITCVDLFCGVGGLSYGLDRGGVEVMAGVDLDATCRFPYEANNDGEFIACDISSLKHKTVKELLADGEVRMLAGCAPCQPFSTYTRRDGQHGDWGLLYEFGRLVSKVKPELVTMENVPGIVRHDVYREFVEKLKSKGYKVSVYPSLYCPDYGIPQLRKRLVLLASRLGDIELVRPTHGPDKYASVRGTIGGLEPLEAGEASSRDPLHVASGLSSLNLERIQASVPGGTWRDWPRRLLADCHRRESGKTYPAVYGRMEWDKPSPTITTQCFGYGNGRFGHPDQDRAISLREAAMLQTFPKKYKFLEPGEVPEFKRLGRLIGNAVPVRLGEIIARSVSRHLIDVG